MTEQIDGEKTESRHVDEIVQFFKTFCDEKGEYKYRKLIEGMAGSNKYSLIIDYFDLVTSDNDFAIRLVRTPHLTFPILDAALHDVLSLGDRIFADENKKSLHVRLRELLDYTPLKNITGQINKLVTVQGLVTRASVPLPMVVEAVWHCSEGHTNAMDRPGKPKSCIVEGCEALNFFFSKEESTFGKFQILKIQESNEDLPSAKMPEAFDIRLEDEMVGKAKPGDTVKVTGIVSVEFLTGKQDTRLLQYQIQVNYIEPLGKSPEDVVITEEERDAIRTFAAQPNAYQRLIASIAPAIEGEELAKECALLLSIGSYPVNFNDGTAIRGTINALICGDPGLAKSQLLGFMAKVAPRGIYSNARASSAAGLTAAVVKEKNGMLYLEPGVVVLADQGIACMTEETELYNGSSVTPVEKIWNMTPGPVILTKTGREAKNLVLSVTRYDNEMRADIPSRAFMIMRRRHQGDVIRVMFSSGLSIRVTPEHLLRRTTRTKNLWIRAERVKPGDLLLSPIVIAEPSLEINCLADESYVIGFIYGDGYVTNNSITISHSKVNMDAIENIRKKSENLFALYDKGERVKTFQSQNVAGQQYFFMSRMYQLYSSHSTLLKHVNFLLHSPSIDNILLLSKESLWAFFAGVIDSDGNLSFDKNSLTARSAEMYPTRNEHELTVLLYALRRLGIYARIRGRQTSIPKIQIRGSDLPKFLEGIKEHSVKVKRAEPIRFCQRTDILRRGTEKVVEVIREQYDGYVYDLSVGHYHNFEASLVYVHNCIDEFLQMSREDAAALHEAMEQGTVSVSKAGFVSRLNARTSILAAANPLIGKYDPFKSILENLEGFAIPLLTRFDMILIARDVIDPARDEKIGRRVVTQIRKGDYQQAPPLSFDLLRKYIVYAKSIRPELTEEVAELIVKKYAEMRRQFSGEQTVPITPRWLESLIRISIARSRALLHTRVSVDDVLHAINMLDKTLRSAAIDPKTKKVDLGLLEGKPASERGLLELGLATFKQLSTHDKMAVEDKAFIQALVKTGKFNDDEADKMLKTLYRSGQVYETKPHYYKPIM